MIKPVSLIYELRLLANSMHQSKIAGWSLIDQAVVEIARLAAEVAVLVPEGFDRRPGAVNRVDR